MAAVKITALLLGISPLWGHVTSNLLRIGQKSPPAPLYLMFYGGAGLFLICGCVVVEKRQWFERAFHWATVCGEASLFVFLSHFYLFWMGLYSIAPGGVLTGGVIFAASTVLLAWAARVWHQHGCNRMFTVGYGSAERLGGVRLEAVPAMWLEPRPKD